jgi:hypothetical protein
MMEENLGKLVEYTIPGDEQCFVISDSKSRMYTRYDPPMEFLASDAGFEMALTRLETFFSFPNINSSNNCIRISIDGGKNWLDLKIPIGSYNIDGINEALQRLLPDKSNDAVTKGPYVVLSGNKYTLKCVLEIMKDSTIVNFDVENSIQSVLGFEKKKYKGGKRYQSENKVNILSVNSILISFPAFIFLFFESKHTLNTVFYIKIHNCRIFHNFKYTFECIFITTQHDIWSFCYCIITFIW